MSNDKLKVITNITKKTNDGELKWQYLIDLIENPETYISNNEFLINFIKDKIETEKEKKQILMNRNTFFGFKTEKIEEVYYIDKNKSYFLNYKDVILILCLFYNNKHNEIFHFKLLKNINNHSKIENFNTSDEFQVELMTLYRIISLKINEIDEEDPLKDFL